MLWEPNSPLELTRAQVRDVDRRAIADYGMTGLVLMENAGRGVAELLQSLSVSGPVAICCGKGNNAGDGFVVARHLENAGLEVKALLATHTDSFAGDAAANLAVLRRARTPIIDAVEDIETAWERELAQADWIVDALLGTGTQGTVREPFATAIRLINDSQRKVLAIDLPSGLDCDTGAVLGCCVKAQHTATFVARKPGFAASGAVEFTGEVHVLDIGVPHRLLREIIESSGAPSALSE